MSHILSDLRPGEQREIIWGLLQEDIDNGVTFDSCACPVALSLRRVFPGLKPVVSASTIKIYRPCEDEDDLSWAVLLYEAELPILGQNIVVRFDSGHSVEPISLAATFVCF